MRLRRLDVSISLNTHCMSTLTTSEEFNFLHVVTIKIKKRDDKRAPGRGGKRSSEEDDRKWEDEQQKRWETKDNKLMEEMKEKKLLCRLSFLISQSSFSLPILPTASSPLIYFYEYWQYSWDHSMLAYKLQTCCVVHFFFGFFLPRWRICDRRKQEHWKCLIKERKRQAISDERRKIRSQSNDLGGGMEMMMKMKLQRKKLGIENSMMIRNHFFFLRSSILRCRRITAPDPHPQSFRHGI